MPDSGQCQEPEDEWLAATLEVEPLAREGTGEDDRHGGGDQRETGDER